MARRHTTQILCGFCVCEQEWIEQGSREEEGVEAPVTPVLRETERTWKFNLLLLLSSLRFRKWNFILCDISISFTHPSHIHFHFHPSKRNKRFQEKKKKKQWIMTHSSSPPTHPPTQMPLLRRQRKLSTKKMRIYLKLALHWLKVPFFYDKKKKKKILSHHHHYKDHFSHPGGRVQDAVVGPSLLLKGRRNI